ncbi:MAG: glycosyltransferase [Sinobacteraceae bacterium]|nr:glycosyltransferase [Nevskiaceae bacterium]
MVTSSFPIKRDGSEAAGAFVADLAEELSAQGRVRVVAPGSQTLFERWKEGVEIFRYAAPSRPLSLLHPWRPDDWPWLVRVLRGGLSATRAASRDDARHILAFWGLPGGEWARRAARERGIGYSVWLLGSDVWSLGRVPLMRSLLARVIRQASRAYADGHQLAAAAQHMARAPVEFLPSTRRVDAAAVPPPRAQAPYRLLFLGRWHPNKGVDLLLDALALLEHDDWQQIERVEIQGGGPLEAQVRERVTALRAAGHPVEAGHFLNKAEAEAAIMRADWVLIPSRIESIPLVFSDALQIGRPVVCSPVGDLPTLASNVGVVARAVSAEAWRTAIRTALRASPISYVQGITERRAMFSLASIAQRILREPLGNCP